MSEKYWARGDRLPFQQNAKTSFVKDIFNVECLERMLLDIIRHVNREATMRGERMHEFQKDKTLDDISEISFTVVTNMFDQKVVSGIKIEFKEPIFEKE